MLQINVNLISYRNVTFLQILIFTSNRFSLNGRSPEKVINDILGKEQPTIFNDKIYHGKYSIETLCTLAAQ